MFKCVESTCRLSFTLHQDPSCLFETEAENSSFSFRHLCNELQAVEAEYIEPPFVYCHKKYQNTQIPFAFNVSLLDHNAM